MTITPVRFRWSTTLLILSLSCLIDPRALRAQLWEVPPLPPVSDAQAADGLTATVGKESLHISVCRPSVIHFVAAPEPPSSTIQDPPWMLDSKDSCPGAKFEVSRTADTVLLTTDTLRIELSLKWGNATVHEQRKR